ncbi:MAG: hypothetical protein IJ078_05280 [Succinivibrionaceae bacterium]|jgi:hypothetical protein|nr:hypothetical protein [Succinivibrionaceae bacterium]
MIDYNEDTLAYTVEFDELYVCWDDEPEDEEICERTAGDLRKAYLANINKIAETIKPELVETYGDEVSGMSNDQIIKKLGKPQIYPDSGQVDYVEQEFDDVHVISFEFDDDFSCIDNITIDG